MKIIGNRVLVTRVEEEKKGGFETVEVTDNFVYKGRVAMIGTDEFTTSYVESFLSVGDVVLFTKYSPDTHEVDYDGEKAKIISIDDILAVL